jgi:hypothetical protein
MEECQIVLRNSKNQKLSGVLHIPGRDKKYPGIIICHGMPSNKVGDYRMHVRTARQLCKENFVVMRFDFSGHGDSDGDFKDVTHGQAIDDLNSAINNLEKLNFVDKNRIGLVGHSFGGEIALLKAADDPRIKTLVLHAPRLDWRKVWTKDRIAEFRKKGYTDEGSLRLGLNYLKDRLKFLTTEYAKNIIIPTFIIHGTKDQIIDYRDSAKFIKKLKSKKKKLLLLKNADHDFSTYASTERLIKETAEWLKITLK